MYTNVKHCFHSCHQCDNIDGLNKYKQQITNNLQLYSCARSQHAHAIRVNWLNIITTCKHERIFILDFFGILLLGNFRNPLLFPFGFRDIHPNKRGLGLLAREYIDRIHCRHFSPLISN